PAVSYVTIRGRYFETLGLHVLRGRTFTETDGLPGHESVIVNERLATMFFPNEEPLGRRIRLTSAAQDIRREAPRLNTPAGVPPAWVTIVGISPTVRQQYFQDIDPVAYVPDRSEAAGITL